MEPKPAEIVMLAPTDMFIPDWNPRPFMDEAPLQELMAFMAKGGIVPRIWVWKGNGQAPFAVIAGQRRLEASRRLGRTQVEVEILDISLEDAMFLAVASNRDNKPYWLGEFIAVENLMAGNKDLKQVDIISKLGWPKKRVSYAVNLMKLLTPASRQLIWGSTRAKVPARNFLGSENQDKPSQGDNWRLTEDVAIRLIPLLDPLALEASQAQAEKALKIMVPKQLDGPQTDELVASALSGKDLAVFKPSDKVRKPRARKASSLKELAHPNLGSQLETSTQGAQTQKLGEEALSGTGVVRQPEGLSMVGQGPTTASLASTAPYSGATPRNDSNISQHGGLKVVGHALGSAFHWAGHNSLHLLKALAGYGKQAVVKSVNKSIKHDFNRWVRKLVTAAIVLILLTVEVSIFHPESVTHFIAWFMNVQPPRIETVLNHEDTKASALRPPAEGPALSVPIPDEKGIGTTKKDETGGMVNPTTALEPASTVQNTSVVGNAAPNQTASQNLTTAHSATAKKPETRDEKNARAALVFAHNYFGANYQSIDSWKDFFKQAIDDEDYDAFMDNHFPYDKIHEITDKKLVMSFNPTQPVRLLDSDDSSDTFLVKGVMTTRANADGLSELVSKNSVAAQIVFNHVSSGGYKVGYVKDLTPGEVQALLDSSPDDSADAAKAKSSAPNKIDPLAKAVGDAAGEAAKKTLNLPF